MLTALILLLGVLPLTDPLVDSFDVVEINHTYDPKCGQLVLSQVIWWDYDRQTTRLECIAWRLLKTPGHRPRRIRPGCYVSEFQDGDAWRRVSARIRFETWTFTDPELAARQVTPKDDRRELIQRNPTNARY